MARLMMAGTMFCAICIGPAAVQGGEEAPDLSGYTKKEGSSAPKPVLRNPGFNSGGAGWNLPEGYRVEPAGGRNGTGALLYVRTDPAKYLLAGQAVNLVPGARYKFGAWIKVEDVQGEDTGGTLCLEFSKGGKWLSGIYPSGIKGKQDWTYIEGAGLVPEDADACAHLTLYLRPKMTGRVWFEEVKIEPEAPSWTAYLIGSASETIPANDGKIVLGSLYSSPDKIPEANMACRIQVVAGVRILGDAVRPVRNGRIAADLGRLPEGAVLLRLTLLETADKWILGEQSLAVTVVSPDRPIPANACTLDSRGRAFVNGKPFLPVGLYFADVTPADLERLAQSPFNCIMPYGSLNLKFQGSKETGEKAVREVLDACHTKGLKVIFSIKDVFKGSQWETKEWLGAKEESEIVAKAVAAFKDHPALLAWYVNDELPLSILPRLAARRREVNRLDPFHPTWAVLCQFDELPGYGTTCDILGVDPYPIEGPQSRDMKRVLRALDMSERAAGTAGGMALWGVPQIFNWGTYHVGKDAEAYKTKFRDPTEEEMRAMALLMALRGAKGFVCYSYFDLFKGPAAQDSGRRWPEVCRVGELLVSLAPFLLSDREGPKVEVQADAGSVRAKLLADDKERLRLLVAAVGPGDAKAVITAGSKRQLKSKYGLCRALGEGKYLFEGKDVCADVLEGE